MSERKDHRGQRESKVRPDLQALLGLRGLRVCQEPLALKGLRDCRVI